MIVIPAINARNYAEAEDQMKIAAEFSGSIHLDICDGKYTKAVTWGTPADIRKINPIVESWRRGQNVDFEVHLMVEDPEPAVEAWFAAGVKRVVVHIEKIKDSQRLIDLAEKYKGSVVLGVDVSTPESEITKHGMVFSYFLVLAVPPGFAGQGFNEKALEKIKFLRAAYPSARIEVDGGINPETATLVKSAGADAIVSASYIFRSKNPSQAYQELAQV